MTTQRVNPRVEQAFSLLLVFFIGVSIFYIILRLVAVNMHKPPAYSDSHLEQQIEKTDAQ